MSCANSFISEEIWIQKWCKYVHCINPVNNDLENRVNNDLENRVNNDLENKVNNDLENRVNNDLENSMR